MKRLPDCEFGARLREAFEGARNTLIADKIGVTPSTMTEYMQGISYPDVAKLIRISEITKKSIHWLLTGKGTESIDPLQVLEGNSREVVEELAKLQGKTPEQMLNQMVRESIARRGEALFARYPDMEVEDVEEMRVLLTLFGELRDAATSSGLSRKQG